MSVLDLADPRATPLAEPASVDDHPAWLDDTTISYGRQRDNDVWVVPADGSGSPELFVPSANSPAAIG